MALGNSRLFSRPKTTTPASEASRGEERPPVLPQVTPAKPRNTALQERLRVLARSKAEQKSQADVADCKRRSRRKSMSLAGLITFKTMRQQLACTIVDMSGTGAKLNVAAAVARAYGDMEHLPSRLTLVLRADRMKVDCEIAWRKPTSIGVRFLGPQKPLAKDEI